MEALSGLAMDDVRVHRNSPEPARLGALAFTRGTDIHLGAGQERHLPHEAWHVVQQKQGRVKPTMQLMGRIPINDDRGLEGEANLMGTRAMVHRSGRSAANGDDSSTLRISPRTSPERPALPGASTTIQCLLANELDLLKQRILAALSQAGLPSGPDDVQRIVNGVAPQWMVATISLDDATTRATHIIGIMARRAPAAASAPQPLGAAAAAPSPQPAAGAQQRPAAMAPASAAAPQPQAAAAAASSPQPGGSAAQQPTAMAPAAAAPPLTDAQRAAARLNRFPEVVAQQAQQNAVDQLRRTVGQAAATARIALVGARARAHLTDPNLQSDGTALITEARAIAYVQRERYPEYRGLDRHGHPTFAVQYPEGPRLSIVYSTQDQGAHIAIFHIGPGG